MFWSYGLWVTGNCCIIWVMLDYSRYKAERRKMHIDNLRRNNSKAATIILQRYYVPQLHCLTY